MAENTNTIETETNSDIESGIEEDPWEQYAYVDDGEHAMVVGVSWSDDEYQTDDVLEPGRTVRCALYCCEAGLVDRIKGPETRTVTDNNLARIAVGILEELGEADDRTAIEAAREYWANK